MHYISFFTTSGNSINTEMEDDVDVETAPVLSIADIVTNISSNTNGILINSK